MTNRIPSSLMWLIDKRARIDGQIIKTKKTLRKVEHLVDKLRALESELKSIDDTLRLHEIQIDISNIKPINNQVHRFKLPGGNITKYVLECLILKMNDSPVPKPQIVDYLINRYMEYSGETVPYRQASRAVAVVLNRQFKLGRVIRHHPLDENVEGSWSLSKELIASHSPINAK